MEEIEVEVEETLDETEEEECPFCTGTSYLLGALGWTKWFRCQDCGCEFCRQIIRI